MKISLTHRLLAGFVMVLLLLVANAWVAHNSVQSLTESEKWVTHTYEVLREVETDVSLAKDVETGTRGYVIARQRAFLEPYEAGRQTLIIGSESASDAQNLCHARLLVIPR